MNLNRLRRNTFIIIFGTQTPAGKWFDIILIWLILLSAVVAMMLSIPGLPGWLRLLEWGFTILFTCEYLLRTWSAQKRINYVLSFWGFIDLLSFLPSYLSLLYPDAHFLLVIRIIRILRIFSILKLSLFMAEARNIYRAMYGSRYKIFVFISAVIVTIIILGTLMYLIEGPENGFTSIPQSIYWTVVTLTTVGYGDIVPTTVVGKVLATVMMLLGYALIAVPTGLVSVEVTRAVRKTRRCLHCQTRNENDAIFCKHCGRRIDRFS
ncbi:MAG: voltage-gated potassium channel [Bacteroidales bacterium]|jgi:voltage-gated potassium channel|nr:voltage-gated potassium channel [Bacteroidales bacterium]MDN5330202.1 voltage-gated potassium channel [Bacteroidales bacterium]